MSARVLAPPCQPADISLRQSAIHSSQLLTRPTSFQQAISLALSPRDCDMWTAMWRPLVVRSVPLKHQKPMLLLRAGSQAALERRARRTHRPDVGRCRGQREPSLGGRVAVCRLSDGTPEGGSSSAARRAPRAPMTMIDGGRWSSRCRDEPQLCMQMSMRVRCT